MRSKGTTGTTAAPRFFKSPAQFRKWLETNGHRQTEVVIGFYKKATGKAGMTYKEALDQALCYGWIDGILRSIDDMSYAQRFTPRKRDSGWSRINIRRVGELQALGLMTAAGVAAFEARDQSSIGYSLKERPSEFEPQHAQYEKTFKAHKKAWAFFRAQPPGYRRMVIFRVTSAVKDETRQRRLQQLIEMCAAGRRFEPIARAAAPQPGSRP